MKGMNKIFAFHLLNDRSGSPKVLSQIINGWVHEGREVHLYTKLDQDGFLSNIEGVYYHHGWYKFKSNPWLRLIFYTFSQMILFFKMFGQVRSSDIVYINTVLPFGAALLGKVKGCRVVYHVHESTVNPAILKWFLFKIVSWTASEIINVSRFVAQAHGITTVPNHLVYNAIDENFLSKILPKHKTERPSQVLMICSLKAYKGLFEFIQLAVDHKEFAFRLVLNASQDEIDFFFSGQNFPQNLKVYPSQKNLHPFFQWADVIVNLSRPDGWIETFGLTIIEGMAYGLPALVPPVGGILEVIEDGVTGFSVDSRDRNALNEKLKKLMENPIHHKSRAEAAYKRLDEFKEKAMLERINSIV
jgi:glycosyltransferase involved in cell wall biosynthesis